MLLTELLVFIGVNIDAMISMKVQIFKTVHELLPKFMYNRCYCKALSIYFSTSCSFCTATYKTQSQTLEQLSDTFQPKIKA